MHSLKFIKCMFCSVPMNGALTMGAYYALMNVGYAHTRNITKLSAV